jgi:hypothetical protein
MMVSVWRGRAFSTLRRPQLRAKTTWPSSITAMARPWTLAAAIMRVASASMRSAVTGRPSKPRMAGAADAEAA